MKFCPRCKKWKDKEKGFAKKLGGRQPHCKSCQSEYQKVYYRQNKKAQFARCNRRRAEQVKTNQSNLIDYLRGHPCVDCGEKDILVLQFDHVRGTKHLEIGRMMTYSWRRISEEIGKCDVRCANDHVRKTALVINNYKVQWAEGVSGNILPS